jgi:pilus assembly protein CpaC
MTVAVTRVCLTIALLVLVVPVAWSRDAAGPRAEAQNPSSIPTSVGSPWPPSPVFMGPSEAEGMESAPVAAKPQPPGDNKGAAAPPDPAPISDPTAPTAASPQVNSDAPAEPNAVAKTLELPWAAGEGLMAVEERSPKAKSAKKNTLVTVPVNHSKPAAPEPARGVSNIPDLDHVILLFEGQIEIIKVGEVKRVAVGNAKVISTTLVKGGQLLVIAEAAGITTLHLWFKDGTERDLVLEVEKADLKEVKRLQSLGSRAKEVKDLLGDAEGLRIQVVDKHIVLSGRIDDSFDAIVKALVGVYPEILDLTRKSKNRDLPADKMVLMMIHITEFRKNQLEKLGILWDNPVNGPSAGFSQTAVHNNLFQKSATDPVATIPPGILPLPALGAQSFLGIATEIGSKINFAVNAGDAIILSSPRLVARSGGEATFLAGGEVPLPTTNSLGATNVTFKQFGISLAIKPIVDQNDNIRTNISTEVSAVDPSVTVRDIPGFLTRKTATDVSMRPGETLVMSGLINHEVSKDVNKLKVLGDVPILGSLFRSKNFREQRR